MSDQEYRTTEILILAVDDEPFNLDLIEFAFSEHENVTVIRAENGQVALDLMELQEPTVILLDLSMPVLNGVETLKIIKGEERFKHIPVIVVTANGEESHRVLAVGANDFLVKPVNPDELKLRTFNHAKLKDYHDLLQDNNQILEERVAKQTKKLHKALKQARKAEREIAYRLGRAAEFRDQNTGAHIRRVSHYSALLAELYGLPKDEVKLVGHAAPLHDIGKIGIPDNILQKPGKLTPEEYDVMKQHPAIGGRMLKGGESYPLIAAGKIIATQHHEKYDGTGYPEGLAGAAIHIYGRISAVADVFDALSARRVYKESMPIEQVLDIMVDGKGTHFEPHLVDLLVGNLGDFLMIREKLGVDIEEMPEHLEIVRR